MITREELDWIGGNFQQSKGEYISCFDGYIIKNYKTKKGEEYWTFSHFCEVAGDTWNIKTLKDMDDLKNVYLAITDTELPMFKYEATDKKKFHEDEKEEYQIHQDILDGKKEECAECEGSGFDYYFKKDNKPVPENYIILETGKWGDRVECPPCKGLGYHVLKQK